MKKHLSRVSGEPVQNRKHKFENQESLPASGGTLEPVESGNIVKECLPHNSSYFLQEAVLWWHHHLVNQRPAFSHALTVLTSGCRHGSSSQRKDQGLQVQNRRQSVRCVVLPHSLGWLNGARTHESFLLTAHDDLQLCSTRNCIRQSWSRFRMFSYYITPSFPRVCREFVQYSQMTSVLRIRRHVQPI